jgi:steroid 5-alpha reductase family enzyme
VAVEYPGLVVKEKARIERTLSRSISGGTYAVALGISALVVQAVDPDHPLVLLALGTLTATAVVFVVSVAVDNSSVYDPYWSLQPLAIALYYLGAAWGQVSVRQLVVTALVFLYSVRLTSNFYRDWPGLSKEDFRYRAFRARAGRAYWPVSFVGIHLLPTIAVFLGCLPLYAVSRPGAAGLSWLDAVATVILMGAIALAFVSDEQLRAFRRDPLNQGRCIVNGLWAYSRHPNYLGEITTWWGLWLFALAAGLGWWWTVLGAVSITALFVFVSVPMMERRALATRAGYGEYKARTPMLMLRPRRVAVLDPESPGS